MRCLTRVALATAVVLSAYAGASMGTGTDTRNWDVDGLNGEITASGMLVSAPCVLAPESREQALSLGSATQQTLKNTGDVTIPVDIHVVLNDCPGGVHRLEDQQDTRRNLWLSDQSVVRMTVTGDEEPSDPRFFRVRGSASGISLRMEDPAGELLMPSVSDHPLALNQGRNDLVLKAQLWRNGENMRAGEWSAVVRLDMEYE